MKKICKLDVKLVSCLHVWKTKNLISSNFLSKSENFDHFYIDLIKNFGFVQKLWADQIFCPPDKQEIDLKRQYTNPADKGKKIHSLAREFKW